MDKRSLLGLSLALLTSEALAQTGGRKSGEKRGASRKGGAEPQVDFLDVTLHEFHEDLKLSVAQEPTWEAYAERLKALARDVRRERTHGSRVQMTLPQRLDRTVDLARNRLTAVEDIALAAKSLYAMLTEEQQKTADPRLANLISLPLTG